MADFVPRQEDPPCRYQHAEKIKDAIWLKIVAAGEGKWFLIDERSSKGKSRPLSFRSSYLRKKYPLIQFRSVSLKTEDGFDSKLYARLRVDPDKATESTP